MTALPLAADAAPLLLGGSPIPQALSVYEHVVLPAESAALLKADVAPLVYARVLGYLLLYPPSDEARRCLTLELDSCNRADDPSKAVFELGAVYVAYFIGILKHTRGTSPAASFHPSRPSFDRVLDECIKDLQPAPRNHSNAKASALVRDNFRCMVTGKVDFKAYMKGLALPVSGEHVTTTRCCHIFPDSLGTIAVDANAGKELLKESEAASVWAILTRFGCEDIRAELGSALDGEEANLHRLSNILTLDSFIHDLFDGLSIWFEAVNDKPNFYNIALAPGVDRQLISIPKSVQFVSHHPDLPLPNPRYLHIHATCCRVAHLSGAVDYIDRIASEAEEAEVLSNDGASADVLAFALNRHLARAV